MLIYEQNSLWKNIGNMEETFDPGPKQDGNYGNTLFLNASKVLIYTIFVYFSIRSENSLTSYLKLKD